MTKYVVHIMSTVTEAESADAAVEQVQVRLNKLGMGLMVEDVEALDE